MSKYSKYSKNKKGKKRNLLLWAIVAFFGILLIASIMNSADAQEVLLNIFFTVLLVGSCVAAISFFVTEYIKRKCDEYILENSESIRELKKLNAKYNFQQVSPLELKIRYDNENFYNTVSEIDYLISKLVSISEDVILSIKKARENKEKYSSYSQEVNSLRMFNLKSYRVLQKYIYKREVEIFNSIVEMPRTDFCIEVKLILTNLSGYYKDSKSTSFSSENILYVIESITDKDGEFYRNPIIWDAICRVERAKVSNKMRFSVFARDGHKCCKCGSANDLEVDHIFPISKGGKTVYNNLQTLCHNCNLKKSNTIEKNEFQRSSDCSKHFCPICNARLVLRIGKNGKFYGCSNYPNCKYTTGI